MTERKASTGKPDEHLAEDLSRELARVVAERDALERALRESNGEILRRLARAAALKDLDSSRHMERVGALTELLGQLYGLPPEFCLLLREAAPMHDIGMIGIPDAILRKNGPLDPAEWAVTKQHTTIGAELLAGSGIDVLELASEIALNHHERYDGSGYPRRLAGESISTAGRLVAVVDVFDALVSDRIYRPAHSLTQARLILEAGAGSQFDPRMVGLLLANIERFVQLQREVEFEDD